MRTALLVLALISGMSASATARDIRSIENITEPVEGIGTLSVNDIAFADFTYKAVEGAEDFRITIVRIVHTAHQEEFDRVAGKMDATVTRNDENLSLRFQNPKQQSWASFGIFFGLRKWEYEIEITGPPEIDFAIESAFSNVEIAGLDGDLDVRTAFSGVTVRNHSGRVDANLAFSSMKAERINGSFGVSLAFSRATFDVAGLNGDSLFKAAFGSAKILLPYNTNAEFNLTRAFGGVDFDLDREPEGSGSHRSIGRGGTRIDMDVAFSGMNIRYR